MSPKTLVCVVGTGGALWLGMANENTVEARFLENQTSDNGGDCFVVTQGFETIGRIEEGDRVWSYSPSDAAEKPLMSHDFDDLLREVFWGRFSL